MSANEIKKQSPFQKMRDKLGVSNNKFFTKLQFLGKAMVFPVIVLPLAALLLRFGTIMTDTTIANIHENGAIWYIGKIMCAMGQPAFTYLPIIFAIGLAFGLSKEHRGEAALAGAVAAWVLQSLLGENCIASAIYNNVMVYHKESDSDVIAALDGHSQLLYIVKNQAAIWGLDIGVLGGIVAGSLTAYLYNKFHLIKLPTALAFFEGRRFVCIVAILAMLPIGILFSIIWPWLQMGLTKLGVVLINIGYWGTFLHTLLKSLLVLFGLHQVLNTFLWFQLPITGTALFDITTSDGTQYIAGQTYTVNGDITAFLAGIKGSGLFQIGAFPEIMGGYWGVSIAIILCARKENRKQVAGLMLSICAVSSLTGVGEPLILPIWYASPILYVVHCLLNAIFGTIPAAMGIRAGFGFSAGWVDYCISFWTSWKMSTSVWSNPLWLIPLAGLSAIGYFLVFYWIIKFKEIKTLGTEEMNLDSEKETSDEINNSSSTSAISKEERIATKILEIIGKENVVTVSNCATRLRLEVKDNDLIDEEKIKKLGIYGIKKIGRNNLQIIIGSGVELVANHFEKQVKN